MRYDYRTRVSSTERQVKNWLNFVSSGGAAASVKSIQSFTQAQDGTAKNTTITAVTLANTILLVRGIQSNTSTSLTMGLYYATLTSTTNVESLAGGAVVSNVQFTVLEFNTGLFKSVQRGKITITGTTTSGTATITSVDTTKAVVMCTGQAQTANADQLMTVTLTNATTVTANRGNGGTVTSGTTIVAYEVWEFN